MNLIQKYLRTAVLIGPLPNNILDGQVADAAPVMADFNWIVSQVNTNVPALVTGSQFNVKNFGAVGDGVTDDTAAIQSCLNTAQAALTQNGVVVYFPSGTYVVSSALSIARSGVQIRGDGPIATGITTTNATADILTLGDGISQYTYMSVIGVSFASSVLRTAGVGLHLRFLYNAVVRDVTFTSQFTSMSWSDNCVSIKAENVNVLSVSAGGGGFVIDGSGGHDHYFTDCFLTGSGGNYAIEIRATQAFYMENVGATIWAQGLHIQPTAAGKTISWGFITNCAFDTCSGPCIYISDNVASTGSDYVKGMNFTNCWGSGGRNGVFLDHLGSAIVKGMVFDNCRFFANTQHGVVINNQNIVDVRLQTCQIAGNGTSLANTYDGVNIAASAQYFYITNCNIGQWAGQPLSQQRYGINLLAPTGDSFLIDGNNLTGNGTGPLFNTINTVAQNTSITTNNVGLNPASAMVPFTVSEIWTSGAVRWQADFSNATQASRCMFQDKTTNNNTNVGFISNGTGTTAGVTFYGGSDTTNDSQLILSTTNSGASGINATKTGAGVNFGLVLQYASATAATITTVSDFATNRGVLDQSYSYQTPLTGFAITIANNTMTLILDPAGTLATGTITMPSTPADGQIVVVASSQTVTALTVSPNGGQSIKNAPATIVAGGSFRYQYRNANTTWYKIQ